MFDIGFLEILVVFVIGLLVIGPERLPGAIKTGAIWFSRLKRSIHEARAEFEQQIGADEIRREIHNEKVLESMRNLSDARSTLENKISNFKDDIEKSAIEDQKSAVPDIALEANAANESTESKNLDDENIENQSLDDPNVENQSIDDPNVEKQNIENQSTFDPENDFHKPMIDDGSGQDPQEMPGRNNGK